MWHAGLVQVRETSVQHIFSEVQNVSGVGISHLQLNCLHCA